jgi:hypothetical protein
MILTKQHQSLVVVVGLGVLGAYLIGRAAADKAAAAANAVNPLNNENIFINATNDVGAVITQDENFTLGGWIYDFLHPEQLEYIRTGGKSGARGGDGVFSNGDN